MRIREKGSGREEKREPGCGKISWEELNEIFLIYEILENLMLIIIDYDMLIFGQFHQHLLKVVNYFLFKMKNVIKHN